MSSSISNSNERAELRKFTRQAAGFILLPAAFLLGAELLLARHPEELRLKARLMQDAAPETRILAMGTSEAEQGIRPEFFPARGFNAASSNQSLVIDAQLIDRYRREMPHLQVVIFSVAYFSWGHRLAAGRDYPHNFYYRRFHHIWGDGGKTDVVDLRNISLFFLYGPKRSLRLLSRGGAPGAVTTLRQDGSGQNWAGSADVGDESARRKVEGQRELIHEENIVENLTAVEGAIRRLRADGIAVVLVREPVSPSYIRALDPRIERITSGVLREILRRGEVRFKDYRADPRFSRADFADNSHLSPRGAEKFTRLLSEEILRPLILKKN